MYCFIQNSLQEVSDDNKSESNCMGSQTVPPRQPTAWCSCYPCAHLAMPLIARKQLLYPGCIASVKNVQLHLQDESTFYKILDWTLNNPFDIKASSIVYSTHPRTICSLYGDPMNDDYMLLKSVVCMLSVRMIYCTVMRVSCLSGIFEKCWRFYVCRLLLAKLRKRMDLGWGMARHEHYLNSRHLT